ncbi:Glycosyltransferase involved in cell wall bisynthesis [Mariniphaga anaerophila]|uniref:Glycosyltransferase involved in cell wall bisynthesis n=1 Tax=Mariniphaga anaerophila TaxID=1484053 RepID=A0A1M4YNI8_9BACT|nr:glycosyltransferase family 4 protein [Mariniphaga anaerophila]SHF07350.1 Glycosyltransferase involved in cell wall bisynthesis [Mariniphaga anaerophila]
MKVLMFGWEFPPHISGGLGTACYGLTKGLASLKNTEVLFVVPKAFGDEDQSLIQLIGANKTAIAQKEFLFNETGTKIDYLEVNSEVIPYVTEEEFWTLKNQTTYKKARFIKTDEGFNVDFSGGYGPNLIGEIKNYAVVADIIARENDFDIIHAHDWLAYPAGIAAKRASGKPLVIHVHATDFDRSGGNVNPTVYAIEREGMEIADKIIAVSNFTRQTIIEKYNIPPEKIVTVYNAVEPQTNKHNLNIKKGVNEKLVTFLGRITMQKGPEYFIEAAHLVLKKKDNVRFVMAGSGDKMAEMVERVAHLGMADKFHFTGFLEGEDVNQMFQMTDVFVMPSVSEPFGIVPLEAMQADVPVIISNQSGVSEILKHAIKIDFWDTYAMADAIYGLLTYPALSGFLKKSGKKEVGGLKWHHSAKRVQEIYENLLNV